MAITLNGTTGAVTGIVSASSSDLSTSLAAKAPLASPTFTGTVNASGATLTGAGLDLISSVSVSSATTASINNCFTSAYTNYRIVFSGSSSSTGSGIPSLRLRFRSSGVDNASAVYYTNIVYSTNAGGPTRYYGAGETSTPLTWLGDYGMIGTMDLSFPATATYKMMSTCGQATGTAANIYGLSGSGYLAATAFDGFSVYPENSNISGTLRVYGYRN